jgi:RimJ/RimL family protein N-acetyltransferase
MISVATAEDFPFLYRLYMHPATNPWLLYEVQPMEDFLPELRMLTERGMLYTYAFEGVPVGMFKLQPMKHRNSHIVYLGGVAMDPDHSCRGIGTEMIRSAVALARTRGFKRMELTVATANERAIRVYERAGFRFEGVLRDYSYLASEDKYIDEQVMGLIFED